MNFLKKIISTNIDLCIHPACIYLFRSIPNIESSAIESLADNDSEIESEVAKDTPSTSNGMDSRNEDSSTNTDRLAAVENLTKHDGDMGSIGAKNVTKTAKDKQKRYKCQICAYTSIYKARLIGRLAHLLSVGWHTFKVIS